jgi:REP element-mobilizing transposase RayT
MMDRYREHVRLKGFDYRSNHAYFVTICTCNRERVLGTVSVDIVQPTRRGIVVQDCWNDLPNHHPQIELDSFVLMPNHIHGIICIVGNDVDVAATPASPIPRRAHGPLSGSLSAIVGSFKASVTRNVNQIRAGAGTRIWQPNFYEHVIRNERALDLIREYIENNPARWHEDEHNADAVRPESFERWLARQGMGDAGVAATEEAKHA